MSKSRYKVIPKYRIESNNLMELFQRFGETLIPFADDPSSGVGFFPFTFLDEKVMQIEKLLNSKSTKKLFPFIGEDVKIMRVKVSGHLHFTIAIAMVDQFDSHIGDYLTKIPRVKT